MINVVADSAIPGIQEVLGPLTQLTCMAGGNIQRAHLMRADALLVRSITPVHEGLLRGTNIQFVGTATAGTDHIDVPWLSRNAIHVASAAGANANAVAEYVIACIAYHQQHHTQKRPRIAIFGAGHIGTRLHQLLTPLGFTTLISDPPRANKEIHFISHAREAIVDCDIITLHTPLITTGKEKTQQLIDAAFLERQKPDCLIINTSRGEVLNNDVFINKKQRTYCIDVWNNEPNIDLQTFLQADISTPHIAGYTQPAKFAATLKMYEAIKQHFELKDTREVAELERLFSAKSHQRLSTKTTWQAMVLAAYNPYVESERYKKTLRNHPHDFERLRKHYPLRHEFRDYAYHALETPPEIATILNTLGFKHFQ